ncbi:unnamed protein product [Oppiella nova]|uniref:Uncharacterized protein n=1 Tax=Oppiella nova TaxID=334625 RepID=A0A7R9QPJ7_9ACAR|nr:unnamed protein product [Oppiella nova]CAG2169059.1 unnamed protein product [Oppiella nova]
MVYLRDRTSLWQRKATNLELSLTLSRLKFWLNRIMDMALSPWGYIKDYFDAILHFFRHLLVQAKPEKSRRDVMARVTNLWSFCALVLSACFQTGILSSIVTQHVYTTNTLDEVLESKQRVIVANESNVWWDIKNYFDWNSTLNEYLLKLVQKNRVDYIDNNIDEVAMKEHLRTISDRKAVFLKDGASIFNRKRQNLELLLETGSEMYSPILLGHPVRWDKLENSDYRPPLPQNREILLKINDLFDTNSLKIMIESGIHVISQRRREMFELNMGHRSLERELKIMNKYTKRYEDRELSGQEDKQIALNMDLALTPWGIDDNLLTFARAQWYTDEYNTVILSDNKLHANKGNKSLLGILWHLCRNCGQCKSMYGQYFLGQQCAQHCIDHKELLMTGELQVPDCNAPHSILPYIRKLMDDTDAKNDII